MFCEEQNLDIIDCMKQIHIDGTYQHYKGNIYQVMATAKHSETLEDLVIYKSVDEEKVWARPLEMFLDNVMVDGEEVERFKLVNM